MINIPIDVHLYIMEFLGYQIVKDIYPRKNIIIDKFIKTNFIQQSINNHKIISEKLYKENDQIIIEFDKLKCFFGSNIMPPKIYFKILNRILEQRGPSEESENESFSSDEES